MSVPTAHRIQRSKLLRPAPSRWDLPRPRLLDQLNEGLHAPLSVVTGIAGSGKTSLVRDWAASLPLNTAWISLDAPDNDLSRFLELLAAAAISLFPPVGNGLLAELALQTMQLPADQAIVFSDEVIAFGEPVILILDDFHTIVSPEIFAFLEFLFQFPPSNLHFCLISRTDPPLPLLRYRTRFAYTEIRLAQLLFNREETEAFFGLAVPGELPDGSIDQLQGRTEGWIAGLQLAALALRQDVGRGSHGLGMHHRAVVDSINYIGDEVVRSQPADTQQMLMRFAVPERISAGLAAALLDDPLSEAAAQQLLDSLEDRGLFLTALGDDRTWFRFHPLFRETLLDIFERELGPGSIARIHERASTWFAHRDQIGPALSHALAAGDTTGAVELLEREAQRLLVTDHWREIENWLKLLPIDARNNSIELTLSQGWVHQARGAHRALLAEAERARNLLARAHPPALPATPEAIEAEIELLESFPILDKEPQEKMLELGLRSAPLLVRENRFPAFASDYLVARELAYTGRWRESIAYLREIIDADIDDADFFLRHRELWALLLSNSIQLAAGDLEGARQSALRLLQFSTRRGSKRMLAQAHSTLGRIAYELNDIPSAVQHLREAVDPAHAGIVILSDSALALSLAATRAGDPVLAQETIDQLLASFFDRDVDWEPVAVRSFQARMAWTTGHRESASAWAHSASIHLEEPAEFLSVETPQISQTLILLGDEDPEYRLRGQQALADLEPLASHLDMRPRMIELRLMRAFDLARDDRIEEALDALGSAIEMAHGHIRTFLDFGTPFEELFRRYVAERGTRDHALVLLSSLEAEPPDSARSFAGPPGHIEVRQSPDLSAVGNELGLSIRELEILFLLERRFSNKEIAGQLSISPFTVKRHTSNIYQKLGVSSRRQAVHAARYFSASA